MLLSPADSVGQQQRAERQPLPTLTTAHDAHSLTVEQAAQSYPVHLRAVVTYYDPYHEPLRPACLVADSSGGIYVELMSPPAVPFKTGDSVEIMGFSSQGGYAPIVIASVAHLIAKAHLPSTAPRVTLPDILSGAEDGQWIEVEGMVHAVRESGKNITLVLALADGAINAITVKEPGADYASLVDAKISLRGNIAPLFNQQGQMTGAYLLFPNRAQVKVVEPAPSHPFTLPVSRITSLLRFDPNPVSHHRVHVRGTVALIWPGRLLCIQDGLHGLCAQTDQSTPLHLGEVADVIGFLITGAYTPTLSRATYKAASYQQPVPVVAVTPEQAQGGNHDAQLVELEGQLIGQDDSASDPTIVLSSGTYVFSAVLPASSAVQQWTNWRKGTTFKIIGICSVEGGTGKAGGHGEGLSAPKTFRILLRSPQDVVVIRNPSWWTSTHAIAVLGVAAVLTLVVLTWVYVLRQQVLEQTHTIRQQLWGHKRSSTTLAQQAEQLSRQDKEIRKLNEDLEARIARRTTQLELANSNLEAFSYSVSHDLRAPLRHIGGFSNLLVKQFGPGMAGEAREYLQHIEDAVHRMGLLIDGLLGLAKIGPRSLQMHHTELNPIVDEVISILQSETEGRDVEWRVAQLPAVDCDPILMGQVLQNLFGNALKYSRGCTPAIIEVDSIQQPGKPAVIFVRDNGAGFDIKHAERLFGVFQRMHTESEFEGAGVGLATVQRIIRKHGGAIWAEAEVDRGATFYFTVTDRSASPQPSIGS